MYEGHARTIQLGHAFEATKGLAAQRFFIPLDIQCKPELYRPDGQTTDYDLFEMSVHDGEATALVMNFEFLGEDWKDEKPVAKPSTFRSANKSMFS